MGQLYSHLIFRPPTVCSYQSADGLLKYLVPDEHGIPCIHQTELLWLHNSVHVRIPCAWVRQPHAEYVVLYAHQNGEDLGSSICDAHTLSHGLGVDVLAFEYSGYGLSEKSKRSQPSRVSPGRAVVPSGLEDDRERVEPSEKACCSDIDAAYEYLTKHCGIEPRKIVVFGRSIGSGPAVHCASTRKVGGLVLIAPIASAVRVPLKRLNVTLPFIDMFPNIDRASKIQCPVLVVHGDMDELVPKVHGERLFEKIKQNGHAVTPLWIPDAKHNNVVEDFQSLVFKRYMTFLEELKAAALKRKSLDGSKSHDEVPQSHSPRYSSLRSHRPRATAPLLCHQLSPTSCDDSNSSDKKADDDRRSRDIRARNFASPRFQDQISFHDTLPECDAPISRRYCGLYTVRDEEPFRLGNTESVLNAFGVYGDYQAKRTVHTVRVAPTLYASKKIHNHHPRGLEDRISATDNVNKRASYLLGGPDMSAQITKRLDKPGRRQSRCQISLPRDSYVTRSSRSVDQRNASSKLQALRFISLA